MRNVWSTPALGRKCGRALSAPLSFSQRERERKREREREKEGERERERERDVEYGIELTGALAPFSYLVCNI